MLVLGQMPILESHEERIESSKVLNATLREWAEESHEERIERY